MPIASIEEIALKVGQEVGVSDWIEIGQARIDAFAEITEDRQFIHVDPEGAARTPFGGTVAHGFLTLSLLSRMAADAMPVPEGVRMGFRLERVDEKRPGQWQFTHQVTVEIEGEEKPALVADWIGLIFV
jgi:acyl dehydratase